MKKRIFAAFLALCMVATMLPTMAFAGNVTYVDLNGHWCEEPIYKWSDKGIVNGVGKDTNGGNLFDPDGLLTREQAAAIFARLLKLEKVADVSFFKDVVAGQWYVDGIAKCYAAGIINGTGIDTFGTGAYLTRADMFTMFCRALGIEGQDACDKIFDDAREVPSYAKEYTNALVNLGYVGGVTANTLQPLANITRAQMVALLDKAIVGYITEDGEYEIEEDGIVLIVGEDLDVALSGEGAVSAVVTGDETEIDVTEMENADEVVIVVKGANNVKAKASAGTTVVTMDAVDATVNGEDLDKVDEIVIEEEKKPASSGTSTGSGSSSSSSDDDDRCIHRYDYAVDAEGHREYCYKCDEWTDRWEEHEFEQIAAESGYKYVCTVCDYVCEHDWSDLIVDKEPTCEEEGSEYIECVICGARRGMNIPALGHIEETIPAVEPTCTETGLTEGIKCAVCGEILTAQEEIPALGHTDNDGNFICDVCDTDLCVEHTKETILGKAATCTEAGLTEGTKCSVCGDILVAQEVIPALGHTEEAIPAVEPTCTETGLTEGTKCSVCGEILTAQEEIPALGHDLDDGVVTTEPTCEDEGVKTFSCSRCDYEETEPVDALGHDFPDVCACVADVEVACANECGETETVVATGHTFELNEEEELVCSCCGATEDEALKFWLGVTSADTTVEATVYDDYSAVVVLPEGFVNTKSVTLEAKMQDVASLGGGTKYHKTEISTGINGSSGDGIEVDLGGWLGNVYDFKGATVDVTIGGKDACSYDIGAYADGEIVATPANIEDTRDAWAELTGHISTDSQDADDSYASVAYGSFAHIGYEKLVFEPVLKDCDDKDLVLDNFSDLSALEDEIRDTVTVIEADEYAVQVGVAAGTELAVGQSIATLDDDCIITVTSDKEIKKDILSELRNSSGAKDIIKNLVMLVNEVVGAVDGETVEIDFTFEHFCKPVVVEEATCTTNGLKECKCGEEEEILATGHTYDENGEMTCCDEDDALKFALSAESDGTEVTATVYDDYAAVVVIPDASVDASSVTVTATMQDVASLGVEGTRKHDLTIGTGLEEDKYEAELHVWMENAFMFEGATVNVDVEGEKFVYDVKGYGDIKEVGKPAVVVATPDDVQAARDAWAELTKYVDTNTDATDSKITVANGSYLAVGGEILEFEKDYTDDYLVLDNFNKLSELKANVKAAVCVNPYDTDGIEIVVAANTALAVGSTEAVLNKDCTITITGFDAAAEEVLDGILSGLRDAAKKETKDMLMELVVMLNSVVGAMNGQELYVTVNF